MSNCCKENKDKCCGIGFHSIPAALGDDTGEFKPENGAYHNMLVKYEENGALYFYANDGVWTKLVAGVTDDTLRLSVVVEDSAPVYTTGGSVVYDYGGQSPAELITYWLIEGVSFVDSSGTSYTTKSVYNLLAGGKKIIFDDVPFGKVPNGYMPVEGFGNYPVVSGLSVNARAEDSSYETDSFTGSVSLVFNTAPSPIVHQWGIEKNHIAIPGEEPIDEYYLIASSLLRNSA